MRQIASSDTEVDNPIHIRKSKPKMEKEGKLRSKTSLYIPMLHYVSDNFIG